mgnify:CR=1 FL=1
MRTVRWTIWSLSLRQPRQHWNGPKSSRSRLITATFSSPNRNKRSRVSLQRNNKLRRSSSITLHTCTSTSRANPIKSLKASLSQLTSTMRTSKSLRMANSWRNLLGGNTSRLRRTNRAESASYGQNNRTINSKLS